MTTAVTKLPQICESAKKIEVNSTLKNCSPLKVADLNLRQMLMGTVSKTFENGIVYLAIVLYNDARAERALIFGLGAGCMAAAVLLRNCSKGMLRSTQLFFH